MTSMRVNDACPFTGFPFFDKTFWTILTNQIPQNVWQMYNSTPTVTKLVRGFPLKLRPQSAHIKQTPQNDGPYIELTWPKSNDPEITLSSPSQRWSSAWLLQLSMKAVHTAQVGVGCWDSHAWWSARSGDRKWVGSYAWLWGTRIWLFLLLVTLTIFHQHHLKITFLSPTK